MFAWFTVATPFIHQSMHDTVLVCLKPISSPFLGTYSINTSHRNLKPFVVNKQGDLIYCMTLMGNCINYNTVKKSRADLEKR